MLRQSILPWAPVLLRVPALAGLAQRRLASTLRVAVCGWRCADLEHPPLDLPQLPGLRAVPVAELQRRLRDVLSAASDARHEIPGVRAGPAARGGRLGKRGAHGPTALMRIGIQYVLDEPGRYVLLSLSRVRAFFEFWPDPHTSWLHNVGRVGSIGLLIPFVLYGLYRMRKRTECIRRSGLLLLFAAFYTLLHLLTWAMARYRLPVDAVMMPWAGWAIADLGQRVWRGVRGAQSQHARTRDRAYSLARPDGEAHSDHRLPEDTWQ